MPINDGSIEDLSLSKFREEFSSVGSHGDMDDFSAPKDSLSHISELENTEMATETSNCIVLSNADMVEHVLLDWTVWVTTPIPLQIALLGFLEHLVSMHCYRNHNLTILRRINLVQHLLVTLQRGDVEVSVLENLVVLLGAILEDGFLLSELEQVVRFVIMTFDPPELTSRHQIMRESMGKHVIVRNMLLDLQVTITSENLLEQWHKIISSKLITYFLDEAVHPTSMRWVMTLLGVCLVSSPTFALKFRSSGGNEGLARVLPSFYDSPDIYYILFCLIFGKPVYPRLSEVRMLDSHALMPSDGIYGDLKFTELLESVIAMAKETFDRLSMQSMLAHQTGNLSQISAGIVAELAEDNTGIAGELQGEALMHKTYAARPMGGEASAPASATSVLSLPHEQKQSAKTSISTGSFPQGQTSTSSEDMPVMPNNVGTTDIDVTSSQPGFDKAVQEEAQVVAIIDRDVVNHVSTVTSNSNSFSFRDMKSTLDPVQQIDSLSLASFNMFESPILSKRSYYRTPHTSSTSPVISTPLMESAASISELDSSPEMKSASQGQSVANTMFMIGSNLLLEVDDCGYGRGPCSARATSVLDFMVEVLSGLVNEQVKAVPLVEGILESAHLYVDAESILVFQGMCLSRLLNFLERRLLRDDEEDEKKLDKGRWSLNLEALCWLIVDRVYMGDFPRPAGVLKTLEFLLSMLQLANKDGRVEEAAPTGKGILSIGRGSRQLDAYAHVILKNTNKMILFSFLPLFLITIGEDELLS
ncbi:hypothetical protein K7X08_011152 [Anisodus acutangulus]|uniref:Uncharacterized protein n=1 Tax=Anisodus acutangulus TaxID=402998 RepID=A0A9Q1RAV6_9SOLA|nr:hypothetical protein K7X08_011152 [Anisodus acutangulus]